MQYDGDEQIEEDSGTVLPAIVVEGDFPFCEDNKNTFTSDRKVKLTSTKPALLSRHRLATWGSAIGPALPDCQSG